jgi:flagellar hook-associated protein 2
VGVDIAGTIGGQPASGNGQTLTGSDGSAVAGLKIDITGGAIGERGKVGFSQGYAYQLNNLAANFLGASGAFATSTKGLNTTIADIGKQRTAFADKLEAIEKRYRAQYTALDSAIAGLNSTSNYLTQQFAAMTANND